MRQRIHWRVASLALSRFRGFVGDLDASTRLDLDADVVVLSGGNGFGKTSAIDALNLALNGRPRLAVPAEFVSRKSNGKDVHERAHVLVGLSPEASIEVSISSGRDAQPEFAWPSDYDLGVLPDDTRSWASVFYQDEFYKAFDEGRGEARVQDVLAPPPEVTKSVLEAVRAARARIDGEQRGITGTGVESEAAIERDRKQLAETRFTTALAALREQVPDLLPDFPPRSRVVTNDGQLSVRWLAGIKWLCRTLGTRHGVGRKLPRGADALASLRAVRGALDELRGYQRPIDEGTASDAELDVLLRRVLSRIPDDARLRTARGQTVYTGLPEDADAAFEIVRSEPHVVPLDLEAKEEVDLVFESLAFRAGDLDQEISAAEAWIEHATSASGPGLVVVLRSLAHYARQWQEAPSVEPPDPPGHPPEALRSWLREIAARLADAPGLDDAYDAWEDTLRTAQTDLAHRWTQFADWLELQSACNALGRHLVRRVGLGGLSDLPPKFHRGNVLELLGETSAPIDGIEHRYLDDLIDAVDAWVVVEERSAARERAIATQPAVRRAIDLLAEARAVADRETHSEGWLRAPGIPVPRSQVDDLRTILNRVLRVFRCDTGIRPVDLIAVQDPSRPDAPSRWELRTGNGRSLRQLSTGQATQLAIAWTVALNLAFGYAIPHRVLMLDDVTTAWDMSQLPRVCVLIRQLAYYGNPSDRRQVIISCHHEELTHRLLDFLMPPHGCRLKVVDFRGWTPATGPLVKQYEAPVAPPVTGLRDGFAQLVRRFVS